MTDPGLLSNVREVIMMAKQLLWFQNTRRI